MKRLFSVIMFISLVSFGASAFVSSPALAKTCGKSSGTILTFKPWYYGLINDDCSIKSPADMDTTDSKGNSNKDGMQRFVTRIALTIVEDLLQLAGYVTVAFIIMGGFTYMTSSGAPDKAARGQKQVLNAVIGLVVAMASVGLVNFIAGYIGL